MYFNQSRRYLFVGIWNTLFGYLIGILVYKSIINISNIILVGLVANFISISASFLMYKIVVFKTSGNWIKEYLKSYIVYGITALISIFILWFFVEYLKINIYISQAGALIGTITFSYYGHKKFTFIKN